MKPGRRVAEQRVVMALVLESMRLSHSLAEFQPATNPQYSIQQVIMIPMRVGRCRNKIQHHTAKNGDASTRKSKEN